MFTILPIGNNIAAATRQLFRQLNVRVTDATLRETLEEHPDYPSLLSISDSLRTWKVESVGLKVSFEQLINLPRPLLVHLKTNQFIVPTDINEKSVTYFNGQHKKKQLTQEEFLKQWDGVVLLAAGDVNSGEEEYKLKWRREILQQLSIPSALLAALILTALNAINLQQGDGIYGVFPFLIGLVMLAGMVVSGLLLWYEIDKHNPVLQKICTAGKHTNCSAILQSGVAKFWGIITWSEVGFAYFTGGYFALLLSAFDPTIVSIVAWIFLLATPYIFFSVFYQWRIAKQWCLLCLTVQFLLLAGFVICLTGSYYTQLPHGVSLPPVTLMVVTYGLPLLLWRKIKPMWVNANSEKHYKLQLLRLQHDPRIFDALLPRQRSISQEEIQHLGISFGNAEAKHKLIKVCNPYCGPCAQAHPHLEEIIENNPDVCVQIIFTATDDDGDPRSQPVRHLMAIDEMGRKKLTRQALDDWYNAPKKDYQVFACEYPLNGELKQQGEKLKSMNDWCEKTGISFTPTFFIDGYQLPNIYNVEDLKYLLA